jgi:lysozyme family protein
MSDNFDCAVEFLLNNEGGFSYDPDDSGGKTNFGITERELIKYGPIIGINCAIEDLKRGDAITLYKKFWWEKYNYDKINSRAISTKSLDLSVNIGEITYNNLLQRAINDMGYNLVVDGIIGKKTLKVINEIDDMSLLTKIKGRAINHYKRLVVINPKLNKFLNGWLIRAEK